MAQNCPVVDMFGIFLLLHLNPGNIEYLFFLNFRFQMVRTLSAMSYVLDQPFEYWTSR